MPSGRDTNNAFTFNWPTQEMAVHIRRKAERGFRKAAAFAAGEMKLAVSKLQVPSAFAKREAKRAGVDLDEATSRVSKPGEPPALRTGMLLNSIQSAPNPDGTARVGSTVLYAFFLEFGTDKMEPRPFIAPTMIQNLGKIKAIIEAEIAS